MLGGRDYVGTMFLKYIYVNEFSSDVPKDVFEGIHPYMFMRTFFVNIIAFVGEENCWLLKILGQSFLAILCNSVK